MITLTQNEEKILTKIRQLSLDKIQKFEEFIDQLLHSDNLTFPVKSKIQQCKPLEPLSGNALRENSL
jgi:hypothetical protein